jgi:uncharacterized protein YbcI
MDLPRIGASARSLLRQRDVELVSYPIGVATLSKESLEIDLANAVARYHREQQGRAPGRIKVTVSGNMVFVISSDTYTPSEEELHQTDEGRKLIKSARRELRSLTRESAHAAISRVVGCPVVRSYWDLDVRVGEQLEAYVLSEDIERRLSA